MQNANAWHYTTFAKFKEILQSNELKPATEGISVEELPVTWFSTHKKFEPTAYKMVLDQITGRVRRVRDIDEMFELGGGLVRLGMPMNKLLTGDSLREAAKITPAVWTALVRRAYSANANASDWWGCVGTVPISELVVELMEHKTRRWKAVESDQHLADYELKAYALLGAA